MATCQCGGQSPAGSPTPPVARSRPLPEPPPGLSPSPARAQAGSVTENTEGARSRGRHLSWLRRQPQPLVALGRAGESATATGGVTAGPGTCPFSPGHGAECPFVTVPRRRRSPRPAASAPAAGLDRSGPGCLCPGDSQRARPCSRLRVSPCAGRALPRLRERGEGARRAQHFLRQAGPSLRPGQAGSAAGAGPSPGRAPRDGGAEAGGPYAPWRTPWLPAETGRPRGAGATWTGGVCSVPALCRGRGPLCDPRAAPQPARASPDCGAPCRGGCGKQGGVLQKCN